MNTVENISSGVFRSSPRERMTASSPGLPVLRAYPHTVSGLAPASNRMSQARWR